MRSARSETGLAHRNGDGATTGASTTASACETAPSRLRGDEIDIGNPKHRPAPGQVTQTLLVAILVTTGNLDILETWLYQRTGAQLSRSDYDYADPQPPAPPEAEPARADRTATAVHHRSLNGTNHTGPQPAPAPRG